MSATADDLPEDIEALKRMVLEHRAMLDARKRQIDSLALLIAKLRRMQFGRSSERLAMQIDQLVLELEVLETDAPVAAAPQCEPEMEKPESSTRPRRTLPDYLPRKRIVHEVSCNCPEYGARMKPIGEDASEVLDYVPAQFWVTRHVRPKLACTRCDAIAQACAPARVIDRGLPGPGLLAHILVAKYADQLPL